jgi:Domain of unknown function (DUF4252)
MRQNILIVALLMMGFTVLGQSKTTLALEEEYGDMFTLYFYKNTLRMLNQKEDKDFDQLIQNVEKMKFLVVDKSTKHFDSGAYQKLTTSYKEEHYEPIVTSRLDGRNFDVFLNDKKSTPGTVVLVNDSTSMYILDIVGTFDFSKVGSLFSVLDGNQDVSKMLDYFDENGDRKDRKKGKPKIN